MTLLLVYLTIAIGFSFLCSILEAVLLSITPSYIAQLEADNPSASQQIEKVKSRLDESLSSILTVNTIAHTMGAAGVGSQALQVFGPEWETLIAVSLTLAILYFSEIIPKTLGATFWRQLAVPSAFVISWLVKVTYPLVWFSTLLTKLFSKNKEHQITREEIIALAALGHKDGNLIAQENAYLSNLLKLREIRAEEILTPRSVVHMLDETMSVSSALNEEKTRQFTRFPIYAENQDTITGKVMRADLFEAERNGHGDEPIKNFANDILRVSEKLPIHQLLDLFIKKRGHIAIVEDEFGQNAGVVTLEDAIETLLGREIVDENDSVADMQELARIKYRNRLRDEKPKP